MSVETRDSRRRFSRLLAGILAFGCLGASPNSLRIARPEESANPGSAADQLRRSTETVLARVSAIRNLPATGSVDVGLRSRNEIRRYVLARMAEEYPPEELDLDRRLLVKLALIPESLDYRRTLVRLLTEQVAGYYDPKARTLHVADWVPVQEQLPVMAHELAHALQDQHFDLDKLLEGVEGNEDTTQAHVAVVEGEGLGLMLEYVLEPAGMSFLDIPDIVQMQKDQMANASQSYDVFRTVPAFFREALLFPYVQGARFLQHYVRRHGWPGVDRLYADLPRSTEQILHPEKYESPKDEPTHVEPPPLPAGLGGRWERIYRNVLGEFMFRLILDQFLEADPARGAAAGWDGDSVQLFEGAEGELALWIRSVWDTEQDAAEFVEAYEDLIRLKYGPAGPREDPDGAPARRLWRTETDVLILERAGLRVDLLEATLQGPSGHP
ncbi:MAG: hypothetical protein OXT71_19720 [Acidobacteriota bacterium]|nr:hypothetical protein [Acidobacteriota bacterium]